MIYGIQCIQIHLYTLIWQCIINVNFHLLDGNAPPNYTDTWKHRYRVPLAVYSITQLHIQIARFSNWINEPVTLNMHSLEINIAVKICVQRIRYDER